MFVSLDPVRAVHTKYAYAYAVELLLTQLTHTERQVVYLHCGLVGNGKPIGFPKIAEWFSLGSPFEAERIYVEAIVKIRCAIPGSALENWIVSYRRAYHFSPMLGLDVSPYMPVPVWDGRAALKPQAKPGGELHRDI